MLRLNSLNVPNRLVNWDSTHTKKYRQLRDVKGEDDSNSLSEPNDQFWKQRTNDITQTEKVLFRNISLLAWKTFNAK